MLLGKVAVLSGGKPAALCVSSQQITSSHKLAVHGAVQQNPWQLRVQLELLSFATVLL